MSENIPYDDFVRSLFNRSGDPSKDFAHAILGIVTEIHEYRNATSSVNGLEELGDLEFFLTALLQVIDDHVGLSEEDFDNFSLNGVELLEEQAAETSIDLVISDLCNGLLDDAKRWVGYGRQPRNLAEVFAATKDLVEFVNRTGPYPCLDEERRQATNMAKLMQRYNGVTFSQHAALNRDTAAEYAAIAAAS